MKKKFLDLGKQPIANGFLNDEEVFEDEFFFNLAVEFDTETKLVSLKETVKKENLFHDNYAYSTSMSKTMIEHFKKIAQDIKNYYGDDKILEIGSNDGAFLRNFSPKNIVAVEPCGNFAKKTEEEGYKTINKFWNMGLARNLPGGKKKIIYSANCMCHIENIEEAFKAVEFTLDDDGVFIFEDPSLIEMLRRNSYDQIYDEHVHIFSVTALNNLLNKCGLKIIYVEKLSVHGGSNRIFAVKNDFVRYFNSMMLTKVLKEEEKFGINDFRVYYNFGRRVYNSRKRLFQKLIDLKREGKKIIGYGATSKSSVIYNYCRIDDMLIDYVVDTTLSKFNKYMPGVHIPIVEYKGIPEDVDYAFLGAWNYEKEILEKEKEFIERGGKFITHVPYVREIGK